MSWNDSCDNVRCLKKKKKLQQNLIKRQNKEGIFRTTEAITCCALIVM